jgi:beta-glucanase (GH16 family)
MSPALRAGEIPRPFVKDGSLAAYPPVWSDEFDGASLDLEKWGFRTDSKMWSTQKPDNVEVSGGTLKLHLKKEEAGDKHYSGSGVISKTAFRYGYYEARMKIPPGAGWHTSFWMMLYNRKGGTTPATACQELDVIENDSIHKNSYGVNIHKWKTEHISFGGKTVKTPDLSAAFHVYGCLFTPDRVTYYFDGDPVQSVDVTQAVRKDHTSIDFEHGDQNIWLTSIASSLGNTKAVDDAALPAIAEFDYVRYFKTK